MVRDQTAVAWINASSERRSIYVGRTRIHGVMIAKNDALVRQLPQRRRIFLANEIRPHAIPNNNHDMSLGFRRLGRNCSLRAEYANDPRQRRQRSLHRF